MTSSSYTCLTCHVGFKDSELQRQHHKSDWHWYNLKRKVRYINSIQILKHMSSRYAVSDASLGAKPLEMRDFKIANWYKREM